MFWGLPKAKIIKTRAGKLHNRGLQTYSPLAVKVYEIPQWKCVLVRRFQLVCIIVDIESSIDILRLILMRMIFRLPTVGYN